MLWPQDSLGRLGRSGLLEHYCAQGHLRVGLAPTTQSKRDRLLSGVPKGAWAYPADSGPGRAGDLSKVMVESGTPPRSGWLGDDPGEVLSF